MSTQPHALLDERFFSWLGALESRCRHGGIRCCIDTIGASREGRRLVGIVLGDGSSHVSITAGAHADEPAGPLAAMQLADWLTNCAEGRDVLRMTTWHICPQVNPDGLARNAPWFAEEPVLIPYARHADREPPGDDVEFNYPGSPIADAPPPRPENQAVARFLARGAPFRLHSSLHGMSFADGAWWLIGAGWAERSAPLRAALAQVFARHGLGLHDIDRGGEKGFTRLSPGFSTTPTSVAMREHFLREARPEMARLFLPSSMEFVGSLGGDPLVMVSEIPLFVLTRDGDPSSGRHRYWTFRDRWREARNRLDEDGGAALDQLAMAYGLMALRWDVQTSVIREGVIAAVHFILDQELDS